MFIRGFQKSNGGTVMTKKEKEIVGFEMKKLKKAQKKKADKIVMLLLELQEEDVWPVVIDGGGGDGLQFYSCKKDNTNNVEESMLNQSSDRTQIIKEYVYAPNNTIMAKIPTIIP